MTRKRKAGKDDPEDEVQDFKVDIWGAPLPASFLSPEKVEEGHYTGRKVKL